MAPGTRIHAILSRRREGWRADHGIYEELCRMMYQGDDDCGFDGVHQLPQPKITPWYHLSPVWIVSLEINHVVRAVRRLKLRE